MQPSPGGDAIGALGFWDHSPPGSCAYDLDFTAFFASDLGVDAVRFKTEGISPQGYGPEDQCP